MKVSLFITCLVDVFSSEVGKDTVELLEKLGCEVDFPEGQTCCGQPAFNSGYLKESKETMKHMIKTFQHVDYIVSPSGSCITMLKEYKDLFRDEPVWADRAANLSKKSYELAQFIVDILGVEDVGARYEGTATYHTSCHMTRLLGVNESPIRLLQHVEGLNLIPLPFKQDCCGFGGTFSVKMASISEQMVEEKVQHIESTDADVLIGADCGCLMNIGGRINRLGKNIEVKHLAQILNHS
ncbi:(Fe-S)-binding protein [Pseudalkalibacillus hwajinpoensis]|uniref:(Fe-S)-binding protein n=1 Tax=Guptibacillus hwajinpoensis TaxID=208199 RepID=UPI00325A5EE4